MSVMTTLAPFRLRPHFDPRIWGVRCLKPWYDHKVVGEPIGEVWLTGDQCVAETGPLAGQTLDAITRGNSSLVLGAKAAAGTQFPLLMKVLFPNEKLSVQVHPDDKMAQKYGDPRGKTECWYALESSPSGSVALGLKPDATVDSVAAAIKDETLESQLDWLPVHAGDLFFVDAGTVHAIGPGCVLLETQQNCDLTYRMYDYGRGRELHLDKAFEAMRLKTDAGLKAPRVMDGLTVLIDAQYFRVEKFTVEPGKPSAKETQHEGTTQILFVMAGAGEIRGEFETVSLSKAQVVIVPSASPTFALHASEPVEIIRAIPQ
jgi:mannose-6-phosphate isomerase